LKRLVLSLLILMQSPTKGGAALLHGRQVSVCVYALDLLKLDGQDLRELPLEPRRARPL
jgi:ATP-dependent DNA ligase